MTTIRLAQPRANLLALPIWRHTPKPLIAQAARLRNSQRHSQSRTFHFATRSAQVSQQQRRPQLHSPVSPRGVRTLFIQQETTPNADALKFLPNHQVLPPETEGVPFLEYLTPRSTISAPYPSPLAARLLDVDGVTGVLFGPNFITVNKAPDANWAHVRPEVFSLITEAITSGEALVTVKQNPQDPDASASEVENTLAYNENDSETVGMIKELLETRIRPVLQDDGGDVDFRGFEDGYVLLKLRGACRGCDSSSVTLKNGIEGMLMHYVEDVKGVREVTDPEEDIAKAEFEKFEQKLREQKGPDAAPSAFGKGGLDSVPG